MEPNIIDGAKFWSPLDGVVAIYNMLDVLISRTEDGSIPTIIPAAIMIDQLKRQKMLASSVAHKAKAAMLEWNCVRKGTFSEARPIKMDPEEISFMREFQTTTLPLLKGVAAVDQGKTRLELTIARPGGVVWFNTESQLDFMIRSLDEMIALARDGRLRGPASGQIWLDPESIAP